ncbi:hypothetical protein VS_II1531 [Vibrio atlanticus]|uniref:Uncharacterized protein n=1 Tax=Vibrio atlanticus (strain LGP32) TaxID=575788 RepID=B7VU58_VIBA3|nr:hypothetical protein VS_II1531 [Vibrio atlanticus]
MIEQGLNKEWISAVDVELYLDHRSGVDLP